MNTDSISQYYESICKHPILSTEEEQELIHIIYKEDCSEKKKQRAKDKLIQSHLRFVFKKAKQRAKKGDTYQFEELISVGNEGLVFSLSRYNPDCGVKFLSYAGWWVMQRQLKEQSKMRIVSLPIWKQQLAARIAKEVERVGRILTDEELVSAFPDYKLKDLKDLSTNTYLTYYMEDFVKEDTFIHDLETSIMDDIEKTELYAALAALPDLEREVLERHFGIIEGKEDTLKKISTEMKISRDQVKEIKERGLLLIRELFLRKGGD